MSELRQLNERDLQILLSRIKASRCSASLRNEGSARMLGHLHVRGLEEGVAIQLSGVKHRDLPPAPGTPVTLSFLVEDGVVAIRTVLLEPVAANPETRHHPPLLRAAWPTQPLEFHRRDDVRVAAPELPALGASLLAQGQRLEARLLNLTETGMGLGLRQPFPFRLEDRVEVETLLPGGFPLHLEGSLRHWEILADDPLPVRVGLVLCGIPAEVRETLRGMIQARRIIRSEAIREP